MEEFAKYVISDIGSSISELVVQVGESGRENNIPLCDKGILNAKVIVEIVKLLPFFRG